MDRFDGGGLLLRADSVLALLVGKQDLTGEHREWEQDRGNPWPVPPPSTGWNSVILFRRRLTATKRSRQTRRHWIG
ncbi:MAG: hypothetical protein ACK5ME_00790 [Parahaliea sp.]